MADDKIMFDIKEGVSVTDQVMTIIAGLAATEVDGVTSLSGNITNEQITKTNPAKLAKGVRISLDENNVCTVKVSLNIAYGYEIPKVSVKVQEKVKTTIESMTGMDVASVDVRIASVSVEN